MTKKQGTNARMLALRTDFLSSNLYSGNRDKVSRMLIRKADQITKIMQGKGKLANGKRAWTYAQRQELLAQEKAKLSDYIQRSEEKHGLKRYEVNALEDYLHQAYNIQIKENNYLKSQPAFNDVESKMYSALESKIGRVTPIVSESPIIEVKVSESGLEGQRQDEFDKRIDGLARVMNRNGYQDTLISSILTGKAYTPKPIELEQVANVESVYIGEDQNVRTIQKYRGPLFGAFDSVKAVFSRALQSRAWQYSPISLLMLLQ